MCIVMGIIIMVNLKIGRQIEGNTNHWYSENIGSFPRWISKADPLHVCYTSDARSYKTSSLKDGGMAVRCVKN